MLSTTTNQNNAINAPLVRIAYFVEFQFRDGTQYLSTLNFPVDWGGHTWSGVGTMGSISEIVEAESMNTSALNFTINGADPAWLALATGDVADYRGKTAKMYFCPLDDGFGLIDTPVQCWAGVMDMITCGMSGEQASITLKCETSAFGLKRANAYRINAAQQKQDHPTDTGFDYLSDLITNPAVWLTVAFQKATSPYAGK